MVLGGSAAAGSLTRLPRDSGSLQGLCGDVRSRHAGGRRSFPRQKGKCPAERGPGSTKSQADSHRFGIQDFFRTCILLNYFSTEKYSTFIAKTIRKCKYTEMKN